MNTLLKFYTFSLLILLCTVSCKKDKKNVVNPDNQNEAELITTLKLTLVDESNPSNIKTAVFRDPDGDGGQEPTLFDSLKLDANTTYGGTVLLLDETKSPADTISNEVVEEADQHQFFYEVSGGAAITVSYVTGDVDAHGVPLGIRPRIVTGAAGTGRFRVVLKHQGDSKPKTGTGDKNIGDTDMEVDFPVKIQ